MLNNLNPLTRILLWLLCTLAWPILCVAMLIQMTVGSQKRGLYMAIAIDACGNALFGGPPTQTISARTGNGLIEHKRWARTVGPIIDLFFGRGHCLSNVDLPYNALTAEQRAAVNEARALQGMSQRYVG